MEEQGQQEDLEEKVKEYVDCLTDKRYPDLQPAPARAPAQPTPGARAGWPTKPLLCPPVPRPGRVLSRACAWPSQPVCSLTSCWSAASPWPTPWKSASRKVGPQGAGGGPEQAGCWPSLPGLTTGLPAGKGEEQALAAAVLGLLCVQLGPGPKGEEFFHSLQPLLVSVLSDSAASPAATPS